jgi:hypothetical protein
VVLQVEVVVVVMVVADHLLRRNSVPGKLLGSPPFVSVWENDEDDDDDACRMCGVVRFVFVYTMGTHTMALPRR